MLALIDGDIFRYRCAFAAERNYYLVDLLNPNEHRELKEFETKKEANKYVERVTAGINNARCRVWTRKDVQPLENCLQIVKGSLTQALEDVKANEYKIFLSGKTCFRDKVAVTKPYKGNRETLTKPVYYKEVGDYLVDRWNAIITEGIEADDAIGIAAMESKEKNQSYVVVSNDKDLDQIPGNHYDWTTKEFYTVSPKEAKTQFFIQLLSGDPTDNIPGLPGVGRVTAAKMLADCKSPDDMWKVIREAYKDMPKGYLEEQHDLVEILKKPRDAVH